jgi:hypothetical protein
MKTKRFVAVLSLLSSAIMVACASSNSAPKDSISNETSPVSSASSSVFESVSSSDKTLSFTKKSMDFYAFSPDTKVSCNLYYAAEEPTIPFVDVVELTSFFRTTVGFPLSASVGEGASLITIKNEEASLSVDFASGIVAIPDFEHFFVYGAKPFFLETAVLTTPDAKGVNHYLKRVEDKTKFLAGKSESIDLSSYKIPYFFQGGIGYLPLATYSDLFVTPFGAALAYNTKAVFLENDMTPFKSLYFADDILAKRSSALAQFSYQEFCLAMDHRYGLKESHGIESFDDFITRSGFKEEMLSTDAKSASIAYSKFILGYLDDSHSGVNYSSPLAGNVSMIEDAYYGPSMKERGAQSALYQSARKAKMGDSVAPYEEVGGDTAIITFDEFLNPSADYYATEPTLENAKKDTFALVHYANAQIAKNSAITNVVVDLSLNGGGAVDAAIYILSWMLGGVTTHNLNPFDGARADVAYQGDINLDGVFDAQDSLSGKHLYCLTSGVSFSCGNLVPSLLKESGVVTLLGRKSGGGACIVGYSSLPDGMIYQLSSENRMCTRKNGTFYSVDQGAEVDVTLSDPATYYDRAALRAAMESL